MITAISLTGTILNVKKNALCFWLWAFGNTAWLTYDLWLGLYSRAALDVVQLELSRCRGGKGQARLTKRSKKHWRFDKKEIPLLLQK